MGPLCLTVTAKMAEHHAGVPSTEEIPAGIDPARPIAILPTIVGKELNAHARQGPLPGAKPAAVRVALTRRIDSAHRLRHALAPRDASAPPVQRCCGAHRPSGRQTNVVAVRRQFSHTLQPRQPWVTSREIVHHHRACSVRVPELPSGTLCGKKAQTHPCACPADPWLIGTMLHSIAGSIARDSDADD